MNEIRRAVLHAIHLVPIRRYQPKKQDNGVLNRFGRSKSYAKIADAYCISSSNCSR